MMKTKISSGHMVLSLAMGYAVIINLVASSRYEFYPTEMMVGAAFAVGIAMVIGSALFFLGEPKPMNLGTALASLRNRDNGAIRSEYQLHRARRINMATC